MSHIRNLRRRNRGKGITVAEYVDRHAPSPSDWSVLIQRMLVLTERESSGPRLSRGERVELDRLRASLGLPPT